MPHVPHARLLESPPQHVFVFSRHETRWLASAFEAAYPIVRRRFAPAGDGPAPPRPISSAAVRRAPAQGA
jgi:hypothetical protein